MRENVLLLCLSKVSFQRGLTTYVYFDSDNDDPAKREIEVSGYMTNEPSAKVALNLVNLNRIVVICSEDVLNDEIPKFETREKEEEIREYTLNDIEFPIDSKEKYEKYIALKYKHSEYYETVISNYAVDHGQDKPKFFEVKISNDPQEYEIAEAAVEAANKIIGTGEQSNTEDQLNDTDTKKEVHLYIDFNGGPRYIASMLLSTANLIEQRGAVIDNIFTMNIDNKDEKGRVVVERYMGVLQSLRLVSGIKEYADYGRCEELRKYFIGHDDNIDSILNMMKSLADNFQLCDAYRIFDKGEIGALKEKLEDYKAQNTDNPFEILFEYVTKDILECYKPLFNGVLEDNLLDVIDWCLDNDYVQQAVTFYTERMPIYFWEKQIYYPTDDEKEEYDQIDDACRRIQAFESHNNQQRSNEDLYSLIQEDNNMLRDELRCYMDQYDIMHPSDPSMTEEEREERTANRRAEKKHVRNAIKSLRTYFLNRDPKAVWMVEYLGNSFQYDWIFGERNLKSNPSDYYNVSDLKEKGRVNSKINDDQELEEILLEYWMIKNQRNFVNHADASADNLRRWDFHTLKTKLEEYVEHVRRIVDRIETNDVDHQIRELNITEDC